MKKHILFIVENATVPFDRRVWNEALAAKKYGYHVSVICPLGRKANKKYESLNDIDIYRHPAPFKGEGKFSYFFEYSNAIFWEFLISLKIFFWKREPFQIIHSANPPDLIFPIALFYKIFGAKFIFDHHDLAPELFLTKFSGNKNIVYKTLLILEKLSCKLSDVIISTNESYKNIVINRHNIDLNKVFVVRNDPKINEYVKASGNNPKTDSDSNSNKKLILYLGSINQQDGVDVLIRALHYLVNELKERNFKCAIIGAGESLQFVKQTAEELDLTGYIDFKGFISEREKIIDYLRASDICVESAPDNELNRHSTFIKIMEYMAAGKPVVAFDLLETRYSTMDSAILVEPGNVKDFAMAIYDLHKNHELRKELGKIGRERIETELNWKNASLNLLKAYKALLHKG